MLNVAALPGVVIQRNRLTESRVDHCNVQQAKNSHKVRITFYCWVAFCLPGFRDALKKRPLSGITGARTQNKHYCPNLTVYKQCFGDRSNRSNKAMLFVFVSTSHWLWETGLFERKLLHRYLRGGSFLFLTAFPQMRFLQAGSGRNDWSVVLGRGVQSKLLLQLKARLLISKELGRNIQIGWTCFFQRQVSLQESIAPISEIYNQFAQSNQHQLLQSRAFVNFLENRLEAKGQRPMKNKPENSRVFMKRGHCLLRKLPTLHLRDIYCISLNLTTLPGKGLYSDLELQDPGLNQISKGICTVEEYRSHVRYLSINI